ncbi:epoxyqueuosine reductase QueH [Candidatus Woesearchaeota archaeon]|nr:epoxyqueuosine reductase QueH [Candidatus Woesearchaeota archaeon]
MKKLLLHVCCAPCSTHVIEVLNKEYDLILFFYNPNVEPINEYELRLKAAENYAKEKEIPIIVGDYDNIEFHNAVKGHENDAEGGERCKICFKFRLEKAAQIAKEEEFDLFTTTLSVSPYKNVEIINKIGKEVGGDIFLESDFKKQNGYKHSLELSKEHNLYRQHYCGCLYSKK